MKRKKIFLSLILLKSNFLEFCVKKYINQLRYRNRRQILSQNLEMKQLTLHSKKKIIFSNWKSKKLKFEFFNWTILLVVNLLNGKEKINKKIRKKYTMLIISSIRQ